VKAFLHSLLPANQAGRVDMDLSHYANAKTVDAIYEHYLKTRDDWRRPHLGASQIGKECERALWYQFRWSWAPDHDGRLLRMFDTGNHEEARIVADLRAIGVRVWEVDDATGEQINFKRFGGHFAASLDGVGADFPEGKESAVLEFKTANEKSFKSTKKDGVEKSKPVYWAQCQVNMLLSDLDRCMFVMVNKNTDEIYVERIKYDKAYAESLIAKADKIIFSDKPLTKIAESEDWFACKFCEYRPICHRGMVPEVNCRTCAKATVETDGSWTCGVSGKTLSITEQKQGCDKHIYNPYGMPWDVVDAGEDWVEYESGIRNEGNSKAIYAETLSKVGD